MQRGGAAAAAPLSPIAARRIQAELQGWLTSPPDSWSLLLGQGGGADDAQLMRAWNLQLEGSGLYAGETFTLRVRSARERSGRERAVARCGRRRTAATACERAPRR